MENFSEECCGTCRFHRCDSGEWCCTNGESDNYGYETAYDDTCEDYEEE